MNEFYTVVVSRPRPYWIGTSHDQYQQILCAKIGIGTLHSGVEGWDVDDWLVMLAQHFHNVCYSNCINLENY